MPLENSRWLLTVFVLASASLVAVAAPDDDGAPIRRFLEGLDAGDQPGIAGRTLHQPGQLAAVYRARQHAPLWTHNGPLKNEVPALLKAISNSVAHGFTAERYHREVLESLANAVGGTSLTALELLLTDAFLAQARHRAGGAVFPPNLDADWHLPPAEVDVVALLLETSAGRRSVLAVLDALWPTDNEYERLLARRTEIVASGDDTTVRIADSLLIRPGQSGDRVLMLKQRLMGPGEHTPLYDEALLRDVMAFQRAAGLEPDGVVGNNTLDVLNATKVSWIDRIDANLERWRWLPRKTPDTYIRVNIAAYTLRVVDRGRPVLAMNVIVGQPYRRTPVFSESIRYMVLSPYWNVPFSIATKDKLPLLKADAPVEAAKGFETKPHGSDTFVPVDAIDWSNVVRGRFTYLLRQRPGPDNALGRIKFMLPNAHAVYLHDTPGRELFERQERTFSSGCIRLEQPLELARWLLARERHREAANLDALLASGETQSIYLKEPMPVYIVYFTAFSLDDGSVVFRRDIYGRDRMLIDALRAQQT